MHDINPRNWKCSQCQSIIADDLLDFVYSDHKGEMPTIVEFECPHCHNRMKISLRWSLPSIRAIEIAPQLGAATFQLDGIVRESHEEEVDSRTIRVIDKFDVVAAIFVPLMQKFKEHEDGS